MKRAVLNLLICALPLCASAAPLPQWVLVAKDGPDADEVTLHLGSAKSINVLTCAPDYKKGGHWVTVTFHAKRDMHLQQTGHTARVMTPLTIASGAVTFTIPAEEDTNFDQGGTDAVSDDISPKAPVLAAFARTGLLKRSALGETSSDPPVPIDKAAKFVRLCGG